MSQGELSTQTPDTFPKRLGAFGQYILPFSTFFLLFLPHTEYTIPLAMLAVIWIKNNQLNPSIPLESILWIIGGVLFTVMILLSEQEIVSNGLFILNIALILTQLNEIEQMISLSLYSNVMILFTLSHQIFLSIFSGFSLSSVLIFAVLSVIMHHVRMEKDLEIISVLFGIFLGVRAVSWTLSRGFFTSDSTVSDPILENWIKFISSPVLGVMFFYVVCYVLEQINHRRDKILEES
jgi:hypothetical protein